MHPALQPFTLNNGIAIPNRLVVAPLTHWASGSDGSFTAKEKHFLDGRGTDFGLFILAATLVSPDGKTFSGQPTALSPKDLPALKERAAFIKQQNTKAILQIHHGGAAAEPQLTTPYTPVAPSAVPGTDVRALTIPEINALIDAFGQATQLAIAAGFDGVEIHGASGYLLQQFNSPATNHRTDQWKQDGFPFTLAVVDRVLAERDKANRPDFIVGYRLTPEEPHPQGLTMDHTLELIDNLLLRNLQYLHISTHDFFSRGRRGVNAGEHRLEVINNHVAGKLPLIGVGSLYTPDEVAKALETTWVDFVALGGAVLLNPGYAHLLIHGKEDQIIAAADPNQRAHYRVPDKVWSAMQANEDWVPPMKRD